MRILDRRPRWPVPGTLPWYRRRLRDAWRYWRRMHRGQLADKRAHAARTLS